MLGQTNRQKNASDSIICPVLCYSNGAYNKKQLYENLTVLAESKVL